MADPHETQGPAQSSLTGCLSQVVWSMLAPGMVLIAGSLCALKHPPIGSPEDGFLLAAVAAGIVARFLDPSKPGTPGLEGVAPMGPRKYAAWMAAAGALLFVLAHFVVPAAL